MVAGIMSETRPASFRNRGRGSSESSIRLSQLRLTALADAAPLAESKGDPRLDVDALLDGLRHGWKIGEVCPAPCGPVDTKPAAEGGWRRRVRLAKGGDDLKPWIDEDPKPPMNVSPGFRPLRRRPVLVHCFLRSRVVRKSENVVRRHGQAAAVPGRHRETPDRER